MKPGDKRGPPETRPAARTAWILGGIALAIYAGALVLGHTGGLNASWEPQPAAQQSGAVPTLAPSTPAPIQQVAVVPPPTAASAFQSPSRP